MRRRRILTAVGTLLMAFVVLLLGMRLLASDTVASIEYTPAPGSRIPGSGTLLVLVHGFPGREAFEPAVKLARASMPDADLLVLNYGSAVLSNSDPYAIANTLERGIHEQWSKPENNHKDIIIVGYSMGAMFARKALIWAHGLEDDRGRFGRRGLRPWAGHVRRFVSLAGINRGWSLEPKPEHMGTLRYLQVAVGEWLARLSGTGSLILSQKRGAPFIADSRVQWIRLARSRPEGAPSLPQTIHLLGDIDDIVSREDSQDLAAAKDTMFVTLANTGHEEISIALRSDAKPEERARRAAITHAIQGNLDALDVDRVGVAQEDLDVERVLYVMHGIRDYGDWAMQLRQVVESTGGSAKHLKVTDPKYGYFPMLPFLLYADRQENVRKFMDEYTQNLALYPRATRFDFIGHSNGTYILASALQRYATVEFAQVVLAGSVVPKHYPWRQLAKEGRVKRVVNVVAAGDWVVALFPRFFEQIAEWLGQRPVVGLLDIGSGGFRGFEDAQDAEGRIRDIKYVDGGHGAALDSDQKRRAIAMYIVTDDPSRLAMFAGGHPPSAWLDMASNVCWLVWMVLVVALTLAATWFTKRFGWRGLGAYAVVLLGLLYSV